MELEDRNYWSKETLHPYWYLQNHPLHRNVVYDICDETNISDSSKVGTGKHSIDNNVAAIKLRSKDSNLRHNFSIQDIWQVKFPKKIYARYNELHGLFLQLSDYAKNDN